MLQEKWNTPGRAIFTLQWLDSTQQLLEYFDKWPLLKSHLRGQCVLVSVCRQAPLLLLKPPFLQVVLFLVLQCAHQASESWLPLASVQIHVRHSIVLIFPSFECVEG